MPSGYTIHTRLALHRFEPITKSGIIAWEEGCLKCATCVKKRCVYNVYEKRGLDSRQMIDAIDNQCMNCFRCIQGCPKELIHKSINPEYKAIGDSHWTPEIITSLWYQAETGKIPVSGAGYPGPFSGDGFDSMWTDMSEIVRPTRDGIHGREYISTTIDLGRTPDYLDFSEEGSLVGEGPVLMEIPLPVMIKAPAFGAIGEKTLKGWAMAARRLGTQLAIPREMIESSLADFSRWMIPVTSAEDAEAADIPDRVQIFEIPWADDWETRVKDLKDSGRSLLISVRIPMTKGVEEKALSLVERGVSIIHLEARQNGLSLDDDAITLKDGIRLVHLKFVDAGLRDGITLLASGGIALAEHVAKAIICGADAVFTDFPILIALECRMCRRCVKGLSCPVEIDRASSEWVASRVINLMGAWHNQLLEVMGAMGIRDVRRLRGEVGRAMFFEDLERSTFGSMGDIGEGYDLE